MSGIISSVLNNFFPILLALVIFSILVIVHEFGHFYVAKKSGILVEEFAIGMGPLIYSKEKKGTLYSIRAIPMGGYCRMLDNSESGKKNGFNDANLLKRFLVMVAGSFMNFVFAVIVLFFILGNLGFYMPVVSEVIEDYPAQVVGIMAGDKIVTINGEKISVYEDVEAALSSYSGGNVEIAVKRGDEKLSFTIEPMLTPEGNYKIGFYPQARAGLFSGGSEYYGKANIGETISASMNTMVYFIKSTISGFIQIITQKISSDEMSGPIGIVKIIGDTYEVGIKESISSAVLNLSYLAVILSANLGVMNLLPLPALDGGRILFLIIEAIRKKPVDPEKEGFVHFVGFMLLIVLMVFIAYNDITNIFF